MKKRKVVKVKAKKAASRQKKIVPEFKLDLGCGPNKKEGFKGVDIQQFDGKVDIIADLRQRWPWKDNSVDEVNCSHFMEHLTQEERTHFANELYRVLKFGKTAFIVVPAWTSERAYGDPTHKWPPVVSMFFFYWNKDWRKVNAPHTAFTCDFDFGGGNALAHPWQLKSAEVQAFAQNHYTNVAMDMYVTVTKAIREVKK